MSATSDKSPDTGLVQNAPGQTQSQLVYEALRTDIIAGIRPANERLRIERLSQLYGVGATPLREALQRLSADGLVLSTGNRGFSVASLDIAEFTDLNIARTALELEAVRLSISKGDEQWEASLVAAGYLLAKQDMVLRETNSDNLDQWDLANAAFHLATVSACGSKWLLRVRQQLHDQFERYRRVSIDLKSAERDLAREHKDILEAVLARDAKHACTLIEEHFETTTRVLTESDSRIFK